MRNDLEFEIERIIEIVLDCCVITLDDGSLSITKEDVIGKSKKENVTIVRKMLAYYLHKDGFCHTTIALLLNRSVQSVMNMLASHEDEMKISKAYRIANAQVNRMLKESVSQESA